MNQTIIIVAVAAVLWNQAAAAWRAYFYHRPKSPYSKVMRRLIGMAGPVPRHGSLLRLIHLQHTGAERRTMKKIIIVLPLLLFILIGYLFIHNKTKREAMHVFEFETINELPSSRRIEELYGEAAGLFNVEDYYVVDAIEEKMAWERGKDKLDPPSSKRKNADLILSSYEITLFPSYVEFVDAIWHESGVYTNVSPIAYWESSDDNIVRSFQGNIWGGKLGTGTVKVSYRGITKTLTVHVVEDPDASPTNPQ